MVMVPIDAAGDEGVVEGGERGVGATGCFISSFETVGCFDSCDDSICGCEEEEQRSIERTVGSIDAICGCCGVMDNTGAEPGAGAESVLDETTTAPCV